VSDARDQRDPGSLSNRTSYQKVRPMSIRVGQLVEVQLGFMSVRVKKGKYAFLPILRSICILDRTLVEVSNIFTKEL
jgi:hypothetical protein